MAAQKYAAVRNEQHEHHEHHEHHDHHFAIIYVSSTNGYQQCFLAVLAYRQWLQKVLEVGAMLKVVDTPGIEPGAFRLQSGRATTALCARFMHQSSRQFFDRFIAPHMHATITNVLPPMFPIDSDSHLIRNPPSQTKTHLTTLSPMLDLHWLAAVSMHSRRKQHDATDQKEDHTRACGFSGRRRYRFIVHTYTSITTTAEFSCNMSMRSQHASSGRTVRPEHV